MNIFIDANILLDFFRLSGGDLEELRKIAKLAKNEKISLYLSDYLLDEFYRNRESTIAQAVTQFEKSKLELHLPNIVRVFHDDAEKLKVIKEQFETAMKELKKKVLADIGKASLKADQVISEVFSSTNVLKVEPKVIEYGIQRNELGRPPGKKASPGDAIHWEWLITAIPKGENLILVSGDGDFESELIDGTVSSYLQSEWAKKHGGDITLFKSLTAFLQAHFPSIKLADEIGKKAAIDMLRESPNFATTHNAIKKLKEFDDFSASEIEQLIDAYLSNEQIHWILGDSDVYGFAAKLVQYAYDNDIEGKAYPLEEMLNELGPELEEL